MTNFLGVRVAPKFFPGILDNRAGEMEDAPIPGNWHADIAEWGAVLRAVDLSRDTFRIVELGCGWGCWMNNAGAAARSIGRNLDLVGIEGDPHHMAFAHEALAFNGFTPRQYRVIHGIAAPSIGTALFPTARAAGADWGMEPVLNASQQQIDEARRTGAYQELPAVDLATLSRGERISLLHIDIQGGETAYVRDNLSQINDLVDYVVIGTHSRSIEGELFTTLGSAGWVLEMERPAIIVLAETQRGWTTRVDGVQGWRRLR